MDTVTLGVPRDGTSWGLWLQATFEPEEGEEGEGSGGHCGRSGARARARSEERRVRPWVSGWAGRVPEALGAPASLLSGAGRSLSGSL